MYQTGLHLFSPMNLANVEVGKHLYWNLSNYKIHGQVFIVSYPL